MPWAAVLQNLVVFGLGAALAFYGHPVFGGFVIFMGLLVPSSKREKSSS